jgi:ribosomal-protein-alanine N-acetyltransferase
MESQNLLFRRFVKEDIDILHEMEGDGEVMKFTGPGRAQSYDESKERLEKILIYDNKSSCLGFWAPVEKASGKLIGWFMLIHTEDKVVPEIGFMIHRNHWGKGYATEGCRLLCDQACVDQIKKVSARTAKLNIGSIKVLENNDFKKIGEDEKVFFFEKKL